MPQCRICSKVKGGVQTRYDPYVHLNLGIIKLCDRHTVCKDCITAIQSKELMVLHTQLPLPAKKGDINKGVFTTKRYMIGELIALYTGKIVSIIEKTISSSDYMVSLFVEETPIQEQKFVDGDCTAMYINHHVVGLFKQNCEMVLRGQGKDTHIEIQALRDIQPGEELFYDYGEDYFRGLPTDKKPVKELDKKSIIDHFAKVYNAGNLKTNLRDCSCANPFLDDWVKKAKKIVADRYIDKAAKKRGEKPGTDGRKKRKAKQKHKTRKKKK